MLAILFSDIRRTILQSAKWRITYERVKSVTHA